MKVLILIRDHPDSSLYARDINILSLLLRFKKIIGIKFIYEAHSIQSLFFRNWHTWYSDTKAFPRWKSKWYASKENRVFEKADFIVSVTGRLKDILVEKFMIEERKILVIPDATRLIPLESSNSSESDGKKVICYIGQLSPGRGVDLLIEALKYLDNQIELLVVGGSADGKDLAKLQNLARELNLINRITFTGYIRPSEVSSYLMNSDVAVLPLLDHPHSTNFASSLKQFEYMASKRPIVATDLPSTREILRNRENAILVKPNDPEALASGIKLILENEKLAAQIAERAYNDVRENYTWDKRAERILSIL